MIIACTGHTEDEYIKKAWVYQMDEVLPKPTNVAVIKQILEEMIDNKWKRLYVIIIYFLYIL